MADDLIARYLRPGTLQLGAVPPLSLYIHLPWCLRKCPYCDFNSHEQAPRLPVVATPQGGSTRTGKPGSGSARALDPELESRYLDALRADLEASLPLVWGRNVQTIFIGGGTPSLFSPEAITRLPLLPGAEVTLEANPGTFERERFRAFRAAGVNRLSIGVQSFDDAALAALGRVHDRAQAIAAAEEAREAFDTFNLDLMYALPGQDLAKAAEDLRTALALQPTHLSVYHLTIEPNTRFANAPPAGLPDDDLSAEMLDQITALTGEAGLQRYEVSAFAQPGHRCRHNLNYWQFGDYLGIGAGAHSKLSFPHRVVRQVRWREPTAYMEKALGGQAVSNDEEVARKTLPFEFMLNALRLKEGFDLSLFPERTGLPMSAVRSTLDEAQQRGLITQTGPQVVPTARGFDFLSDLQALFLPAKPRS